MKQSLRKYLYVAIVCLAGAHIYAYNTYDTDNHAVDARAFYNCNSVSAHVTDMFRYGEFQTSLFTGRLQVSVPIYTVNDPDFKMNIALHYNAEGFKPRKHSGYVGYNWFLEGGGCITREVKGLPDEIYGLEARPSGQSYDTGIEGMYHFITQNPEAASIDRNDVFDIPDTPDSEACVTGNYLWHNVGTGCTYKVDYMPDIFHFDFLGHKGSFMIDNAGEIQIVSGDFVSVDLSGILANWAPTNPLRLLDQSYPMYPKENSTITIHTTDGYTYIFGGDLSKLEYTVNVHGRSEFLPVPSQYDFNEYNPPTVSTWHLAEIIAPNNRMVTYYYKPAQKPDMYNLLYETLDSLQNAQACAISGTNDPLWEFNECFDRFGKYFQDMAVLHDNVINNNILYGPYTDDEYQCLLAFYNPPYIHVGGSFYLYSATKTCILDSILISGEQPLKIIFHNSQENTPMYDEQHYWSYNNSNSKRNFQLDSVCIFSSNNAIKTASMTYINNGYHYGNTVSNWRFLNSVHISGEGTFRMTYNSGTYPNLYDLASTHASMYHVSTGESDEADDYGYYVSSNYSMALLQKLEYPTGGYQTYSYQQYSYNKKRKYTVLADSNVEMNTVNESGNKRGARIHEVKTFDKLNHLVESKKYTYADGIFYDNLRVYNLAEDLYPQYGWPVRYNANYGLLDTHIGYGKVTEEVTDTYGAKYKTIYQFDLGEDSYTSQNDANVNDKYYCENRKFGVLEGHQLYSSNLRKWGKLISIGNYDSNNNLQRSTCYEYNNSKMCTDTIVVFNCGYGYSLAKKLYVYPDVKTQQVTYDYSQGDSLSISKSYTYDRKLRVKKELVRDSHDILHFTRYSYPDDISGAATLGGNPSPLFIMIYTNRIGTPVETLSGYVRANTEYITSGIIDIYKNNTYPVNNNLYFQPHLYQTLSLALSEPIARVNYQSMSMSNGQVSYDPHYKLDCEYDFDVMYRPLAIKPFGKWATTYTWNGIYPTSKTVGNQTWTYTHIPHVGVSSITDPRGITTYYSYDRHGRLTEEYQLQNGNKRVLNAYHYHIKTE